MTSPSAPQNKSGRTLLQRVFNSTLWQGGAMLFGNACSFLAKLILARLLVPEYFGLVGMAVVFTGIIQTIESLGLGPALIHRRDEDLSETHLYTGYVGYIGLGFLFYFLVIIPGAPLVAWFYEEPQLTSIVLVLALPVLIEPFAFYQHVRLQRSLRFKELARLQMSATFVGAVTAIALAFLGAGVWAIVAQWVVSAILKVILLRFFYKSPAEGEFSWSAFKKLLSYGIKVTGTRLFSMVGTQADYLIIGKIAGASQLGAYSLAFLITDSIRSKLMSVLNKVLFPAYSKLQDDLVQLNKYYVSSVRFSTLAVTPIVCAAIIYSEPIIIQGFGDDWKQAIEPLQLLAVAAMIHTVAGTNAQALKAVGRPDLTFKIKAFTIGVVFVPALLIATPHYGIVGAGWAVVITKLTERIVFHYFLRQILGTTEREMARAILPSVVAGLVMATSLFLLQAQWSIESILQLIGFLLVGGMSYLVVAIPWVLDELLKLKNNTVIED